MSKMKILIISDRDASADVLQSQLRSLGYQLAGVVSGRREAMTKAVELQPDIVVLNLKRDAKIDGIEIAQHIQAELSVPALLISDKVDQHILSHARALEHFSHIVTPYEKTELGSAIELLLGKHHAEMKLIESERWWSATFGAIRDGIITTDHEGRITSINSVAQEWTGLQEHKAHGENVTNVLQFRNLKTGRSVPASMVLAAASDPRILITAQGQEIPIDGQVKPVCDDKGDLFGFVVIFHTISVKGRSEDIVKDSEVDKEHFRTLIENASDIITIVDVEGVIRYESPAVKRILGFTPAERKGTPIFELVHPDEINLVKRRFMQSVQNPGMPSCVWFRHQHKDGSWRVLEAICKTLAPRSAEDGIVVNTRNITERKKAEERFKALLESAPDAMIILNDTGKIILTNEQTQTSFGYSRSELTGQIIEMLIPGRFREKHLARRKRYFRRPRMRNQVAGFELIGLRKDGTEFPIEVRLSPIETEEGILLLCAIRDISDRKRAEEILQLHSVIIRTMAEGVCLVRDRDGVIVYTNPKFQQMFGYEAGELLGRPVSVLNYEEEAGEGQQLADEIITTLRETGEAVYEIKHVRKDGTPFWCRSCTSILDHPEFGVVWVALHEDITERKEVEVRTKYQAHLLANINDAVIASDRNFVITAWNPAAEKVYGWKAAEVIGRSGVGLFRSQFIGMEKIEAIELINRTGEFSGEAIHHRKDDAAIYVEIKAIALKDEAGHITGYVTVNRDISERKKAEQQMRLLLNITQAINEVHDFDSALGVAITYICKATDWDYGEAWVPSVDGEILECTPAWYAMSKAFHQFRKESEHLTFKKQEGLPGRVWAAREPEWLNDKRFIQKQYLKRAAIANTFRAALGVPIIANEEVVTILVFFTTKALEENTRFVELVSTVAVQLGATFQQKRMEDSLRESEERFRGLVESSPDVIIVQQNERIQYINRSGLKLLKYDSLAHLKNQRLIDLFERKDQEDVKQAISGLKSSPSQLLEGKLADREGECIDVDVLLIRTRYEGDPALLAVARDIREKKELREEAERMERLAALGQFSAVISHEIRNPLGVIDLNTKFLSSRPDFPPIHQKKLSDISFAVRRIDQIIKDILDYTRPNEPELMRIDLHKLIDSGVETVQGDLEESGIQIVRKYEADRSSTYLDPNQILQVFINLLNNAREAMSTNGTITIRTSCQEGNITVELEDTGQGIPAEHLDELFEPFFTTKKKGTGLGLSIVHRILEKHKADITVESEVNSGTRFTIKFALPQEQA